MEKLRVKLLAYSNAEIQVFTKGKKRLQKLFKQEMVEFVDKDPEVLVFLTGGSERIALDSVRENAFYLLIASEIDNAWAAATEVKAWMNQNNIESILIDQKSKHTAQLIEDLHKVKNGIKQLQGQRFGLVGDVAEWLVNSRIAPSTIKAKLGIDQIGIPMSALQFEKQNTISPDFINFFDVKGGESIKNSGKIYEALSQLIRRYELHALTIDCFSIIQNHETTSCLALSKLSMDGIPAGCEGDVCSMLGMMMCREFFGAVPWIANTTYVDNQRNEVSFSHCTAPGNLMKDFELLPHFESGKGLAIKGRLKGDEVSIFRVDHTLSQLFVAQGEVISSTHKKGQCHTQLKVKVSDSVVDYFINKPLGNHHLILPKDVTQGLELAARLLKMEIVK